MIRKKSWQKASCICSRKSLPVVPSGLNRNYISVLSRWSIKWIQKEGEGRTTRYNVFISRRHKLLLISLTCRNSWIGSICRSDRKHTEDGMRKWKQWKTLSDANFAITMNANLSSYSQSLFFDRSSIQLNLHYQPIFCFHFSPKSFLSALKKSLLFVSESIKAVANN